MVIPEGMTEEQVVDQINVVVNRMAHKYTFHGYTVDDIKQEAFIICMEALNRYDGIRPLENFLSVNLSNRLKNFIRDNHFFGYNEEDERHNILQPAQLDFEDNIIDGQEKFAYSYDQIQLNDMSDIIDKYLPANLRMDYLKMKSEIYISKHRREEIVACVKTILEEHGYDEEEG